MKVGHIPMNNNLSWLPSNMCCSVCSVIQTTNSCIFVSPLYIVVCEMFVFTGKHACVVTPLFHYKPTFPTTGLVCKLQRLQWICVNAEHFWKSKGKTSQFLVTTLSCKQGPIVWPKDIAGNSLIMREFNKESNHMWSSYCCMFPQTFLYFASLLVPTLGTKLFSLLWQKQLTIISMLFGVVVLQLTRLCQDDPPMLTRYNQEPGATCREAPRVSLNRAFLGVGAHFWFYLKCQIIRKLRRGQTKLE